MTAPYLTIHVYVDNQTFTSAQITAVCNSVAQWQTVDVKHADGGARHHQAFPQSSGKQSSDRTTWYTCLKIISTTALDLS